jgi:diguanylate cyclase (GGDEF)-like protein
MIFKETLVYELVLLSMVTLTLLIVAFKNKGVTELIIFFAGVMAVTISRIYIFFSSETVTILFYVATGIGYLLIAYSVIKLGQYLRSVKMLEHTAFYDPLTKAYNRNFIEEYIKEEMKKARRLNEEFCLLLIDLNDFKQVNDKYGHNAGDVVLKKVVDKLRMSLREYDMIARWGGDEFLVVLPAEKGSNVLEIVNRLVGDLKVSYGEIDVTLSVGYACFPRDGNTLNALLDIADKRMYRSKTMFKEARKYAVDDKGQEEV